MDVSTFTAHRRYLATPDGEIAYTEFGDGPVALFVHGLGTNGVLWRHVIEQLSGTSRCIAIDLPAHGGTPARPDLSAGAMADVVEDLCDGLGLDQVDLVGNDTGGAIAQIFAARHPGRLRTFTLTNCDTEGNFPPEEFGPILELARQGQVAPMLVALYNDPSTWRTSPLVGGYEDPTGFPKRRCAPTSPRSARRSTAPGISSGRSPPSTRPTCQRPAPGCAPSRRRRCWSGERATPRSASSGRTSCGT